MFRRLGSRLHQASGPLALFLVLAGGTAWAVDEYSGANIQDGTLTTADYKNNDIRSADIRADQVKGVDVDESTLTGLVDDCPIGMTMFAESFCLDAAPRSAEKTWLEAGSLCAANGLRLPTVGEIYYVTHYYDFGNDFPSSTIWTDTLSDGDDVDGVVDTAVAWAGTFDEFTTQPIHVVRGVFCAASSSDLF